LQQRPPLSHTQSMPADDSGRKTDYVLCPWILDVQEELSTRAEVHRSVERTVDKQLSNSTLTCKLKRTGGITVAQVLLFEEAVALAVDLERENYALG
jgi:hypothetical protein